jgi:hypothetical protein
MKVNITFEYKGRSATIEDVEFDDEKMVDESYSLGVDVNNKTIEKDFIDWVIITHIERIKE